MKVRNFNDFDLVEQRSRVGVAGRRAQPLRNLFANREVNPNAVAA